MTHQQKNTVAALVSTALIFLIYCAVIYPMAQAGQFDGPDGARRIGKAILVLIIGGVLVTIGIIIALNILFAIADRDPKPSFRVDERDRAIELKGLQCSASLTGFGFVISMGALALGYAPLVVFNLIVFSFMLGNFVGNIRRLRLYRRDDLDE